MCGGPARLGSTTGVAPGGFDAFEPKIADTPYRRGGTVAEALRELTAAAPEGSPAPS